MIWLKKLLEKMLTCVFESEVLYSGNKKTGTFSLDGNPSDYNIIIVKSMTNVEYFADICIISPYLTGNIKYDHEDGTGAYHSSLTIALGNNAMNATVNYNNVNWQLGVVQVIGIKILGGGYFLALFSTIERWWEHGKCKGLNSKHAIEHEQDDCAGKQVDFKRRVQHLLWSYLTKYSEVRIHSNCNPLCWFKSGATPFILHGNQWKHCNIWSFATSYIRDYFVVVNNFYSSVYSHIICLITISEGGCIAC